MPFAIEINGAILLEHKVVVVAQLVRAPGCGPGGRRFESVLPPHFFAIIPEGDTALPDFFCPESVTFRLKKEIRRKRVLRTDWLESQPIALLRLWGGCRVPAAPRLAAGFALACGPGLSRRSFSVGGRSRVRVPSPTPLCILRPSQTSDSDFLFSVQNPLCQRDLQLFCFC